MAGFYVYFVFRLEAIHEESKAALFKESASEFERFELSVEAYEDALVEENEIKINDRMYDVAKVKYYHGSVILFARHDAAEDDLLLFIKEVLQNASSDEKPTPGILTSFLSLQFLKSDFPQFKILDADSITHCTFYLSLFNTLSPIGLTPPPEM